MINDFKSFKVKSTLFLINKYFWKTKVGPIFSIVFPFVFMLIYFALGNSKENRDSTSMFVDGLPAYLSMTIIPLSLVTLPSMNIEFKNSIVLRKVKTSGIDSKGYNLILFLFFFSISMLFVLFTLIIFLCFASKDISKIESINFGSMIFAILMLTMTSITFGMMLSTFMKNPLSSQLSGFGIFILTLTLSGQFIPVQVIGKVDALKYLSLLSPLNYGTNMFNIACITPVSGYSSSLFDFSSDFAIPSFSSFEAGSPSVINLYFGWQKALFVFVPFILVGAFSFLSIKFFKWSGR